MLHYPTGQIDGEDLPDRGTKTHVVDTYGADISNNAKNRIGGISKATQSVEADRCQPVIPEYL
jgi:hypothetical protein